MAYNILILGAAYGSLLGSKMLFGGHHVHHVCLPAEADLINSEGFRVRLPIRGRKDPVVLDTRNQPLPPMTRAVARALADRRTGIGCDQLILLEESTTADFRMRIFNQDGSEVEACGNATRAVALLHGSPAQIETAGGLLAVQPGEGGAAVDMGEPRFEWQAIPLAYAMDTAALPVGWEELEQPSAVNVGNPHAVFFVDDCDAVELDRLGPTIERDPLWDAMRSDPRFQAIAAEARAHAAAQRALLEEMRRKGEVPYRPSKR